MLGQEYAEWMQQMLAKLKEQKFAYLIERKNNDKPFYFFDIKGFNPASQIENHQVVWTPFQRQAALFDSEQQVEEFQSQYITPRKSSIIRIMKPPAMIIMMYG